MWMSGSFDQPLFRKVLYFEWILLAFCALGELIAWKYGPPDPAAPNLIVSVIMVCIVGLLSFFVPVRSGYWDKICFLFLELVLLSGAAGAGLARLTFPLFMVVIAKACLILDTRGIVITGIAGFLAQVGYGSYKMLISNVSLQENPWDIENIITIFFGSLLLTYAAIVLMILVGMLTLALVAAQKSKHEAELLSNEVELLAVELERTRIAREIHDSLGHTLTSLNIQLEVARKFQGRDAQRAAEALETAKQLAEQSLKDVRTAVHSIRTEDFDFKRSVESLLEDARNSQELEVRLSIDLPEISPAIGYQLYRVIQECITNVLKHANANQVKVVLKHDDKNIEIEVSDNGRGWDQQKDTKGFGIKGMRERVESLHGTVSIVSQPDKGTLCQMSIPR